MYLNFQAINNPKLGSYNVCHEYHDDQEAKEAFLASLSCGTPFLTEICKLMMRSVSRIEGSNGYMEFVAQAEFYDGTIEEVKGMISFQV